MTPCPYGCPDKELCLKLGRHIHHRLYEIWQGINIDPRLAQQYRNLWLRQAGLRNNFQPHKPSCCGHSKTPAAAPSPPQLPPAP